MFTDRVAETVRGLVHNFRQPEKIDSQYVNSFNAFIDQIDRDPKRPLALVERYGTFARVRTLLQNREPVVEQSDRYILLPNGEIKHLPEGLYEISKKDW